MPCCPLEGDVVRYDEKVTVYLHSDAIAGCDCGDREWMVQTPAGWMWTTPRGPGPFATLAEAAEYAHSLYPGHPGITRSLGPSLWAFPPAVPARLVT